MPDGSQNPEPRDNSAAEPVALRAAGSAGLPPHPLDKHWFAHVDGKSYGPYSGHEIKRMIGTGQIKGSDFLCAEGGTAWTQAKNEPLLGALFRAEEQAPKAPTSIVTTDGGTVVQVTNNIPNPAANLQAALLLDGDAAAKSPGIALLLSLLICGVGQMYNGQVGKGIFMLVGCILGWIVLLGWIVWIWSMVDAYQTAKKLNLRYQQRVLAGLM